MTRTLYRLEGCPYCEKVRAKLDELDLDYHSVWVEAMHSRRNRIKNVSGQRQTPVLVDDDYGATLAESDRIMEFLRKTYGNDTS